ncbi:aminotransferase class V-fold PLP-dependent enzyme [Mycolicibacterium sp. P9-64]|uniref:pyridoxal phosphate-dependent decarboxylase family protein n=1 Tax=Mycolicibacterium sp. P9-64 TaxID=2024612 RepID=UPI0018D8ED19|nr:aminotransferase class V-fold PLP-dependent enzyme [Mycolicibacterium sp. P9-64]
MADDVWGDESDIVAQVVGLISRRISRASDPKTTARPASELAAEASKTVTAAGLGATEVLRIFEDTLLPATRAQDDPYNLAYIPAAPTKAAKAFDAAVASFNIFAGIWEAGAGAIFAENEALGWLIELLGWPETAGGCFVSGGTMGNLSALIAARAHVRRQRGRDAAAAILCTVDAHSSVVAAARVMDVEVVVVEEDDRGHLTGAAVRDALDVHREVFAVVASSGTTNGGVVDDINDIADVCGQFDVWLHVDGAYGGAGLAAPSVRWRFDGIERADSFIVDPHKWLFAPYDCCALVYRNAALARAAHTQHAGYLDAIDREVWNPADLAVHLSRRARGLPFWFSLAVHGTDRYVKAIERTLSVARAVADGIRSIPALRLLLEPELSVLIFDRPGWAESDYRRWSARLARDGLILCVPNVWQGRMALRLAMVNPATDPAHVIEVLRETTETDHPE